MTQFYSYEYNLLAGLGRGVGNGQEAVPEKFTLVLIDIYY
jgi:hypothetical protein